MDQNSLVVSLCCDDNYVTPTLVCLISLFENNPNIEIKTYIFAKSLSVQNVEKIETLSKIYKVAIVIHFIEKGRYENLHLTHFRWPYEIYFRFAIPEIIKEDRVLYLDGDTMIRTELSNLWNIDLDDRACAVIEDENGDDICRHNRLDIWTPYFNSGVMLMNLKYWRENNISDNIISYLLANPRKCQLPDQDALNVILQDKVVFADYIYNYQQLWFDGHEYISLHKAKLARIRASDPAIIHFCGEIKPWHKGYNFAFRDEYLKYAMMHKFIGFKLTHKHNLSYRFFNFFIRTGLFFRDRFGQ